MLSHNKMVFILPLLTYHLRLFLQLRQFIEHHIVHDLNVGSLHSGGTGLDDACALEFAEGIDDDGAGDAYAVGDAAGYQDALVSLQLVEDMGDSFQLGEGQCADGGFHDLNLPLFFLILLIDGTHHFQAHNGSAILAQDNIVDIILLFIFVQEQGSQTLAGDVNRSDDSLIVADVLRLKAQGLQVYIFLGGQDAQETLIQRFVNMCTNLVHDKLFDLLHALAVADTQYLALLTDDQNVGIQDLCQYFTDIVEYHFAGIVVMQQLIDFSCFIQ